MTDNLEHRMFLGMVVTSDDFSTDKSLVQVGGIWYRYDLSDNSTYDEQAKYSVVNNTGNTLHLQKIKWGICYAIWS